MFTHEEVVFSSSEDESIEESEEVEVEDTSTIVSVNLKRGKVNNVPLPSSEGKCNVKTLCCITKSSCLNHNSRNSWTPNDSEVVEFGFNLHENQARGVLLRMRL